METQPVFRTNLWKLLGERQAKTGERLNITDLSDRIGLSRQTVYKYGNEDMPTVSAEAVAAFCSFLDCSIGEFVELIAPPHFVAQELKEDAEPVV